MKNILHNFTINASIKKVFDCISTPNGLEKWWTKSSSGKVGIGEEFRFFFDPKYDWSGVVSKIKKNKEIEFTITNADKDWTRTKVGFKLKSKNNKTIVEFYHKGWKSENEHFKISNYCWAQYLRVLKRYLELGEFTPYEKRGANL